MFHEGVAPALLLCVFHFPLNKLRRLFILYYAYNRHPATGRKLRGHESGEKYRFILRNKSIDGRAVTLDQMEKHLENIDAE
eukprot:COSAG03_NODE_21342_length_305_cov_1.242718_1_plen_80_part_01